MDAKRRQSAENDREERSPVWPSKTFVFCHFSTSNISTGPSPPAASIRPSGDQASPVHRTLLISILVNLFVGSAHICRGLRSLLLPIANVAPSGDQRQQSTKHSLSAKKALPSSVQLEVSHTTTIPSSKPMAILVPSSDQESALPTLGRSKIVRASLPVAASHMRIWDSSPPDAIHRPSGDQANAAIPPKLRLDRSANSPEYASHTLMVSPKEADAIFSPSGDQAIRIMGSWCPFKVCRSLNPGGASAVVFLMAFIFRGMISEYKGDVMGMNPPVPGLVLPPRQLPHTEVCAMSRCGN